MIKKTVTYEDFSGESVTEDFYFHLTKSVIGDNLDLQEEFEHMGEKLSGEKRQLSVPDVQKMLNLVRRMIELSYGVRSTDGRRFYQDTEALRDFKASGAHDALLWGLFENPEMAIEFLTAIMPQELMEKAKADSIRQPQDRLPKADSSQSGIVAVSDPVGENKTVSPSREELEAQLRALDNPQS